MTPTTPSSGVILERIESVRADIVSMKLMLKEHITSQAQFEEGSLTYRAAAKEVTLMLKDKVEEHDERLNRLEKMVERIAMTDSVIRWVGGLLMASIIALIWAIITHQVTMGF